MADSKVKKIESWEIVFDELLVPQMKKEIRAMIRQAEIKEYERGIKDGKKIQKIIKKSRS